MSEGLNLNGSTTLFSKIVSLDSHFPSFNSFLDTFFAGPYGQNSSTIQTFKDMSNKILSFYSTFLVLSWSNPISFSTSIGTVFLNIFGLLLVFQAHHAET